MDDSLNKANEEFINQLENKVTEMQKKLQKTQQDYMELQEKMNMSREKYKNAALLLSEFLEDRLNQTPNILESDQDMKLNIDRM